MGNSEGGTTMTESPAFTSYEFKILANVEKHGVHVTTVLADPPFTYSTGFTETVDEPEAIVFGLDGDGMGHLINKLLYKCRNGLKLEDGVRISGLLTGFDVIGRSLPAHSIERDYLNSAMWWHRRHFGRDLERVVQIVWPCSFTGLFPWEDGCPQDVIELQPPLYKASLNS